MHVILGLEVCRKKLRDRLQTAQNKIVRYILSYHNRQHVGFQDLNRLGWLNVAKRVDYLALNNMYNNYNATAPSYMCKLDFINHGYQTRRSNCSYVLPSVTPPGSLRDKFCGIQLWTDLPLHIQNFESKGEFKQKCKEFLVHKMKQEEDSDYVM